MRNSWMRIKRPRLIHCIAPWMRSEKPRIVVADKDIPHTEENHGTLIAYFTEQGQ